MYKLLLTLYCVWYFDTNIWNICNDILGRKVRCGEILRKKQYNITLLYPLLEIVYTYAWKVADRVQIEEVEDQSTGMHSQ